MSDDADNPKGHRFKPGQSGNPAGKPRGTRNKVLAALDAIGEKNAELVLQAAINAAVGTEKTPADMQAATLILSRVWPPRRGRPVALPLPPVLTAADTVAALGALVGAVAAGTLSPEEGQAVAAMLEVQRRAIETADLERRVAELEAQNRAAD